MGHVLPGNWLYMPSYVYFHTLVVCVRVRVRVWVGVSGCKSVVQSELGLQFRACSNSHYITHTFNRVYILNYINRPVAWLFMCVCLALGRDLSDKCISMSNDECLHMHII